MDHFEKVAGKTGKQAISGEPPRDRSEDEIGWCPDRPFIAVRIFQDMIIISSFKNVLFGGPLCLR